MSKNSKRHPTNAPNFIFMEDHLGYFDDPPLGTYVPAAEGHVPTKEQPTS